MFCETYRAGVLSQQVHSWLQSMATPIRYDIAVLWYVTAQNFNLGFR